MSPLARRVVYATLYELTAIVVASLGFALFSGDGLAHTGPLAVACSLVALGWNLVFNSLFELWEARQETRGRGTLRRAAHAVGFEGGLALLLAPLIAWWLHATLLDALAWDLALTLFFVVYTYAYTRAFDAVFGLPASARP